MSSGKCGARSTFAACPIPDSTSPLLVVDLVTDTLGRGVPEVDALVCAAASRAPLQAEDETMTAARSKAQGKTKPRLLGRQRHLLGLLSALGGRSRNLDFQKLLFLYSQEVGTDAPYEFVPYKFGAFSFTSYADRRKLIERGLLADDENCWQLTNEGARVVGQAQDMYLSAFAKRHRHLRGDALVAETYRRFPYYATRSEIAERVLDGDIEALRRIESARPSSIPAPLSTIGYERRTLESYLNVLLEAGVTLLCDVRRNPMSRKYGFAKRTLATGCDRVGIRYEHLPQLGIAPEKRRHLETQADYDELFEHYRTESLPEQGEALAQIRKWIRAGERVALTCYERLPEQCHRHCVAAELKRKAGKQLLARHL